MGPAIKSITRYLEYNSAINAVLFDGRFAGVPLYLDIEGPVCSEIARKLDQTPADFIKSLGPTAAGSLSWDSQDIFDWHTEMSARWEKSGRKGSPPFTALLSALSMAAEAMRRDSQFDSHNYYHRLFNFLCVTNDRARQKIRANFKETLALWEALNRWLLDRESELGKPTAQQINGFKYVSYAVSQPLKASKLHVYLDQFGVDNVHALVILDGTPKPRGSDPATEWVETEEGRRWGTITPIEDRAQFHQKFGQWLLEDASPKNVEWITEISAQTSATVTALLNETARHVDYEGLLVDVIKQLPVLVVAREDWRAGFQLVEGERACRAAGSDGQAHDVLGESRCFQCRA